MKWTIGKRILAGLAVNIAFFCLLSLVLFIQIQDFSASYRGLVRQSTSTLVRIKDMAADLHDQNAHVLRYVLLGEDESIAVIGRIDGRMDGHIRELSSTIGIERQRQQLDTIRLMLEQYGKTIQNVISIRRERGLEEARRYLNYEDFIRQTENEMIGFADLVSADMNARIKANSAMIGRIKWAVFLAGLASVIITIMVNARLFRAVTVPMSQLMEGVGEISRGSLEHRVPVRRDDEFGVLARSFNEMTLTLGNAFESVQSSRMSLLREVRDRKQAERELQESEEKFRTLFERSKDAVCFMDAEGYFVDINRAGLELFGYDTVGEFMALNPTLGNFAGEERFLLFLSLLTHEGFVRDYEIFMTERGGAERHALMTATAVRDETGTVVSIQGIMRDITEKIKFQEQIMRMQKMETVGALAGGLAHDFNNVLVGIMGTLSILQLKIREGKCRDPEEMKEYLDVIEQSGVRASEIVKRFLTLSRRQETSCSPLDLNRVISDVLQVCKNSFHKLVGFHENLADTRAMVSGDKTQMEQVVLNLCMNANHAMTIMRKPGQHEGGMLTVETLRVRADDRFCAVHPRAAHGWYWKLAVTDTGVGIPETMRAKIFDPFFSTKKKGEGAGLGLSMVYSIIADHHGFIDVISQEGTGSTFDIFIPALPEGEKPETGASRDEITKGEGLVLVVDDEDMILRTVREILVLGGYRVRTAKSGAEAITIFRETHEEVRAVILDMVMPGMTGDEVFRELKKIDPGVKVLIASGFVQDERAQAAMLEGARQFLQKPYTLERLLRSVHEVVTGDVAG